MPRILAAWLALGLWALAGTAWGVPPPFFPIVYATDPSASPRCTLPFDPSLPQFHEALDPDKPVIPPVVPIPEGATIPLDLCFINWSPSPITGTGTACSDGTGAKTCALKFEFSVAGLGITIENPEAGGVPAPNFPQFAIMPGARSLSVMGGDPINGQNGNGTNVGFRVATVQLVAVSSLPGTFELQSGKLANEKLETVVLSNTAIATVPEPGTTIMLVSGIAFLLAIGRNRIKP